MNYTAVAYSGSYELVRSSFQQNLPGDTTLNLRWPSDLRLDDSYPTDLTLTARAGSETETLTVDVREYKSPTPSGGYRFPANGADLQPGHYWSVGLHANANHQRYAYDLGVSRLESGDWVRVKKDTDGTRSDHYLAWNQPVYAISDGWIVRCYKNINDHQPGTPRAASDPGGGNHLIVDVGGGMFLSYAHFKKSTISSTLCPSDGLGLNDNPRPHRIRITQGQYLGRVGQSGDTNPPHLHVHLMDADEGPESVPLLRGFPLRFTGFEYIPRAYSSAAGWKRVEGTESIMPLEAIIKPF